MTYRFKNAIIRKPNKSIQNGLSSQNLHPQYEIIAEEHYNYIKTMQEIGLKINLLETLEEYPDSCLLYTSPSPRDQRGSRMPSSA